MSEMGKWKPIGTWLASSVGVWTLFEKGIFYGDPRDALAYANRPRNRAKFGEFKGFVIGEVIRGDTRIHFEFFREDARSRKRKAKEKAMKHLKKRGIRRWQYQRFLEKNPLERYLQGKPPLRRRKPEGSLIYLKKRDKTRVQAPASGNEQRKKKNVRNHKIRWNERTLDHQARRTT